MTLTHTNNQILDNTAMGTFATERREIVAIAKRMFNEGFTKSTILRICSMTEEEFLSMVRDLQTRKASIA